MSGMKYTPGEDDSSHEGYTGFTDDEGREWIERKRWCENHAQFRKEKSELIAVLEGIATLASCAPHDDADLANGEFTKIMNEARAAIKKARGK